MYITYEESHLSFPCCQVFSLLMELRSEDQVLTPLLTLLLGEPEVQQTSSDFVMIELVYQTPDFNGKWAKPLLEWMLYFSNSLIAI